MFCLECNKHICRTCLRTEHKKHEITEIEYQEKEALKKEVTEIKMNFEGKGENYLNYKDGHYRENKCSGGRSEEDKRRN